MKKLFRLDTRRALWMTARQILSLGADVSLGLPGIFSAEDLENPSHSKRLRSFCGRITELGYNAIVFGCWNDQQPSHMIEDGPSPHAFFAYLRDQGLQVIIKPTVTIDDGHCCPCDQKFRRSVQEAIIECSDGVDGLFWESFCKHPHYHRSLEAREKLAVEVICEEMQQLEEASSTPLTFYLPAADEEASSWLHKLCDEASSMTTIAFSGVAGAPTEGYRPLHPYWAAHRRRHLCSTTPLLPIINGGHVTEGGGLWPVLPLDLFDQLRSRMEGPPFAGAVALTDALPNKGGLLDCSLWVFGQMLMHQQSPDLLAEEWFATHRPDEDYSSIRAALAQARQLAVVAAEMRTMVRAGRKSKRPSDHLRIQAESVLAQAQELHQQLTEADTPPHSHAPLADYFDYFVRDVRGIVLAFLHYHHVPLPQTFNNDDLTPGFWTQVTGINRSAVSSMPTITCLDEPSHGEPGSPMQQIIKENSLL